MGRVALIDGDEIAYKVALNYQRTWHTVLKDEEVLWKCRSKEEAIESVGNREDLELGKYVEPLEITGFKERLDNDIGRILFNTGSTDLRLYLTGDRVFRYELATLVPYKGNRVKDEIEPSTKPIHLETVREELRWRGAEGMDFLEADDMMSANCTILGREETIICSSDKDLKTVPAFIYDINRKKVFDISEEEANYNFFYQMLIGDSTDNIPWPHLLGPVTASKILKPLMGSSQRDYYHGILEDYEKLLTKKEKGEYKTKWYNGQDIHEVLWEIANLLHMHRTLDEDERWQVPI